jgi:sugar lactone lactonase YvrE
MTSDDDGDFMKVHIMIHRKSCKATDRSRRTALSILSLSLSLLLCSAARPALAEPSPISLPGNDVFPESITSTPDGTLYVGSTASGGVLRVRKDGRTVDQWIKPGQYDTGAIFGVFADERSKTLWMCSNDITPLGLKNPSESKGSALVGVDLRTGTLKAHASVSGGNGGSCNDIAVGSDGSAYATNPSMGQILRLRPGKSELEVWNADPQFAPNDKGGPYIDGIAFGSDGNLYVNTWQEGGFYRIDVRNDVAGKVTRLETSRPLEKPDGMRSAGRNQFLAVEGPGRLVRLTPANDKVNVETLKDDFEGPVSVTLVRNTAWVAEGQLLYLFFPDKRGKQQLPFKVYPVMIGKP